MMIMMMIMMMMMMMMMIVSSGGSVMVSMMTNWRGDNQPAFSSLIDIYWYTGQNCSGLMFYNTKINQAKEPQLVKNMWFVCLNHMILRTSVILLFECNIWSHLPFYTPDTDECASPDENECASKALCTNTEGSYLCSCLVGYQGDGKNCTGNKTYIINEHCRYPGCEWG